MTAALIETKDLHTYYDDSHILCGVSIALRPGETLGLMGRNGMGKTTLIRTIMGLVPPRSGTVHVAGREVTREPAFRIAQLGISYVPEGRGIFTSLSVRENLAIAARAVASTKSSASFALGAYSTTPRSNSEEIRLSKRSISARRSAVVARSSISTSKASCHSAGQNRLN